MCSAQNGSKYYGMHEILLSADTTELSHASSKTMGDQEDDVYKNDIDNNEIIDGSLRA